MGKARGRRRQKGGAEHKTKNEKDTETE